MNRTTFTPVRSQYQIKVLGKVRKETYPTPKEAEMAAAWVCRKENVPEQFVHVVTQR